MEIHKIDHQSGRYAMRIRCLWVRLGVTHHSVGSDWGGSSQRRQHKAWPTATLRGSFLTRFNSIDHQCFGFKFCFMVKWPLYPLVKERHIIFSTKFYFFQKKSILLFHQTWPCCHGQMTIIIYDVHWVLFLHVLSFWLVDKIVPEK